VAVFGCSGRVYAIAQVQKPEGAGTWLGTSSDLQMFFGTSLFRIAVALGLNSKQQQRQQAIFASPKTPVASS
jgi:hypothetical protein